MTPAVTKDNKNPKQQKIKKIKFVNWKQKKRYDFATI
jgi:hypothetical protein